MDDSLIKQLSQLSKNEKLLIVEALWDSIASDPERIDVPEHHKTILEERLESLESDKNKGATWSEIRDQYL